MLELPPRDTARRLLTDRENSKMRYVVFVLALLGALATVPASSNADPGKPKPPHGHHGKG
jgi:hypothetical protein